MRQFIKFVAAIGAKSQVEAAAPTQILGEDKTQSSTSVEFSETCTGTSKTRVLDRWLNNVVRFSGSEPVFFFTLAALLAWALLGIRYGQNTDWQVGISDAQAIINMVFDSFLMRQQLNAHDDALLVSCYLRSRTISHKRMLWTLVEDGIQVQSYRIGSIDLAVNLPTENLLGRICTSVSTFMGHIGTVTCYWICIFIWIGFGPYCHWSDAWFFYINSATSALMIFMLAFLANIRERHENYSKQCLELIYTADTTLEYALRATTGDVIENEPILISAPRTSKIQRCINFYADLVGTLLGIAILIFALVVWVVVGPAMSFDSNWWLLIGTYAGLIGMNDGFVLRNICNVLSSHEDAQYEQQVLDDMELMQIVRTSNVREDDTVNASLTSRLSIALGEWCSHEITVVIGLASIIVLVIIASAMGWNELGQLICNIPPSIIESFFTLILITGHNLGDEKRRVNLHRIYMIRLELISYIKTQQI